MVQIVNKLVAEENLTEYFNFEEAYALVEGKGEGESEQYKEGLAMDIIADLLCEARKRRYIENTVKVTDLAICTGFNFDTGIYGVLTLKFTNDEKLETFVENFPGTDKFAAIVQIINVALALGYKITEEGVRTLLELEEFPDELNEEMYSLQEMERVAERVF